MHMKKGVTSDRYMMPILFGIEVVGLLAFIGWLLFVAVTNI